MHSTADPLLNELAMLDSDKNTRKIILATNIAESSITVPNVKYGEQTHNQIVNEICAFFFKLNFFRFFQSLIFVYRELLW